MAKRFTDTDKYKKAFIRGLPGAYKLLWDYLCCDCNHAGVWHKDFEIAQIYLGKDMPVNEQDALLYFNTDTERVRVFDDGLKWFISPFVGFQYGKLNPQNRAHQAVLQVLEKIGIKPLIRPSQGCKEKEKEKEKDKEKDKEPSVSFEEFYDLYPKHQGKADARKAWASVAPSVASWVGKIKPALMAAKDSPDWLKEDGRFIPLPASWLRGERWEDEIESSHPLAPKLKTLADIS